MRERERVAVGEEVISILRKTRIRVLWAKACEASSEEQLEFTLEALMDFFGA